MDKLEIHKKNLLKLLGKDDNAWFTTLPLKPLSDQ